MSGQVPVMVQYLCTTLRDTMVCIWPTQQTRSFPGYVLLLQQGWSARAVARYMGYAHTTIVRWSHKKPVYGVQGSLVIPTLSSRPHHHPKQLPRETVTRILELRAERRQCAEIIHHRLSKEGVAVSLSSVKRVLRRNGCSRYSRWKKWHQYPPRSLPEEPGVLSRTSLRFVHEARHSAPFPFQCIQTDHGSEFSKWFTKMIEHRGILHRHSRVRRPTDNGHVERFIRTLQDECLYRIPRSRTAWTRDSRISSLLQY